jgi:hypothetical protein
MNTKLEKLAKLAGFDTQRLKQPHPGGWPSENMLALESFADVILGEVAQVLHGLRVDDGSEWDRALVRAMELIHQRFQIRGSAEYYTCPYRREIFSDFETLCNCDDAKRTQCLQDI